MRETVNDKNTILILHGWRVSSKKYSKLRSELFKKKYNVLIPDMPGNGAAPDPDKPFTLDGYVAFIKNYLISMKCKQCSIIGHSFGGRVGLRLTTRYPDIVNNLILTGVPGYRSEGNVRRKIFSKAAKTGNRLLGDRKELKIILYKLARRNDYLKLNNVMKKTFENIINEDLGTDIKIIENKVLIIWGKNDALVPIKIAKKMHKNFKNSKLIVIPNSGHDLPYSEPRIFSDKLLSNV